MVVLNHSLSTAAREFVALHRVRALGACERLGGGGDVHEDAGELEILAIVLPWLMLTTLASLILANSRSGSG